MSQQVFNVDNTLGAYTLGTLTSSMLFGVTCFQTYHYFNTYSDIPLLKLLVMTLTILVALHVGFSIHGVYHYLITDYFSPASLLNTIWSVDILFGITAMIAFLVQMFYATQIYILSGKRPLLPLVIIFAALIELGVGWILVAVLFDLESLLDLLGLPETLAEVALSTATMIDITISITLTLYLARNCTGEKRLINRLIIFIITKGVLISVFDIVTLTLLFTRPRDLVFFGISQVLASLYTNSFLATLNSRKPLANEAVVSESYMPNSIRFGTIVRNSVPVNGTCVLTSSDAVHVDTISGYSKVSANGTGALRGHEKV